jgi:hypothetical protein
MEDIDSSSGLIFPMLLEKVQTQDTVMAVRVATIIHPVIVWRSSDMRDGVLPSLLAAWQGVYNHSAERFAHRPVSW